jgi:hypothetical protein
MGWSTLEVFMEKSKKEFPVPLDQIVLSPEEEKILTPEFVRRSIDCTMETLKNDPRFKGTKPAQ